MASKIFISYRRDDSAGHAGRVHDRLEKEYGRDLIFMDVDSIPLGVNFADVLNQEVSKCNVLLALIGPNWLKAKDAAGYRRLDDPNDFVRIEIATALLRAIPVIPIFLEGAKAPAVAQLPDDLKELSFRNGLQIRHDSFQSDMDRLLAGLQRPQPQQRPQRTRKRRTVAPNKPGKATNSSGENTLGAATIIPQEVLGAPPAQNRLSERWTHETTEDDNFTGRAAAIRDLNSWFATSTARIIAVTGMGGLGKTSLVAHWLKKRADLDRRGLDGLFFWSIYSDRDIKRLFREIVNFGVELGAPRPTERQEEVGAALQILRQKSILLFIDGLELLQDTPAITGDGAFLSEALRELLDGICRARAIRSLAILTSRFSFADLAPYRGLGFRSLQLDHLAPDEGATLLEVCGVGGTIAERKSASRHFHGHPLGLRVFALTLEQQGHRDPSLLIQQVFGTIELSQEDPLERRLRKLLEFYEKEMPRAQAAILGIVSFFRSLAPTSAIVALARRLPAVAETTVDHSDSELRAMMDKLARQHLLIGDPMGENWSCHPILRDHFRQHLLGWSPTIARGAAGFLTRDFHVHWSAPHLNDDAANNLLTARPSRDRPRSLNELEPIVTAVELLLETNDLFGADQLFRERLDDGNVFRQLALPGEGMRCALSFVRNEERRGHCERKLGKPRLADYARQVGVFARQAGEFEYGLSCFRECTESYEELGQEREVCISLQNWTGLLIILGRLSEAERNARRAVEAAGAAEAYAERKGSLTYLAAILGKLGNIGEALSEFETARKIELSAGRQVESLFGNRGVRYADLLLRLDRCEQAQWVTEANLQICRENNWQEETAQCWSILGEIASRLGHEAATDDNLDGSRLQFNRAEVLLKAAEQVFRAGHTIAQIPRIVLARGELERRQNNWENAHELVEEGLNLAAPRQMRLDHTDALLLRSRILLDEAGSGNFLKEGSTRSAERSIDDADLALQIARECGYAWGVRDALQQLACGYKLMGSDDRASSYGRDALLWSTRLADPEPARRRLDRI